DYENVSESHYRSSKTYAVLPHPLSNQPKENPARDFAKAAAMTAGGREEVPPLNGGEFLLRLVQKPLIPSPLRPHGASVGVSVDPAVAAMGPTIPHPLTGYPEPHHPPNFLIHGGFPQSSTAPWPYHYQQQQQQQPAPSHPPPPDFAAASRLQFNFNDRPNQREQSKLMLGTMSFNLANQGEGFNNKPGKRESLEAGNRKLGFAPGGKAVNGSDPNRGFDPRVNLGHRRHEPGFGSGKQEIGPTGQLGRLGVTAGSALHSESATEIRDSLLNALGRVDRAAANKQKGNHLGFSDNGNGGSALDDGIRELSDQMEKSLLVDDEADESSEKKKKHRDKDFRSDPRGGYILPQRVRKMRVLVHCRDDIQRFNSAFLEVFESLIPVEEEKAKQKQLFTRLQMLVCKEWPSARLFLYGSCANSFGFPKSDLDVCLAIGDQDIDKPEFLLRLADILQKDNLENVQALTRARVPIVKLKDPVTGISCDICINNVLAVVNTKLLRDYGEIDGRLRQLAFIVKHWAKSRAVNETYQGTLSSYAYVLMCIHFLQQRKPAILPCLQMMEPTYAVTVDGVECSYFDKVDRLQNFGARNREGIAQLVWGFFNYWAYSHDYTNNVVSVRTGSIISKQGKDWTRRIGNDRHLICIEDPFETSHDLGRVVDKNSIRVLREEFERAAEVMQFDSNPCRELLKPFIKHVHTISPPTSICIEVLCNMRIREVEIFVKTVEALPTSFNSTIHFPMEIHCPKASQVSLNNNIIVEK
ncbi:hypothetical protein V2J09_001668, partial [Rumex salicifolius]